MHEVNYHLEAASPNEAVYVRTMASYRAPQC